jgi:hypothetical protein
MTDTSKATPRPWTHSFGIVYDQSDFEIVDTSQGPHLHKTHTGNHGHWAATPNSHIERSDDECDTNAALIVKAVNSYDVMLEALKSIAEHMPKSTALEGGASAHSSHVRAADKVRAAIALAEST